jgi:quinol monooxygenase YgiN
MREDGTTGEIVSTTRVMVSHEKRKELFLTISSLLDPIRNEEGCRDYRFYAEEGNEDSFILVGEWEARRAWTRHLESEHFAVLLGCLKLLNCQTKFDFKLMSHVPDVEELTAERIEH